MSVRNEHTLMLDPVVLMIDHLALGPPDERILAYARRHRTHLSRSSPTSLWKRSLGATLLASALTLALPNGA